MVNMLRVRAVLSGWQGAPGLATFHYIHQAGGDPFTAAEADACADRVRAAYFGSISLYPTRWNVNIQGTSDVIDSVTGELQDTLSFDPGTQVNGSQGADFAAASSGICVNWLTPTIIGGHRVRGRTFLSPLAPSGDSDGTPTPAQAVQALGFADGVRSGGAADLFLAVWHRPVNKVGGVASLVTGVKVSDRFSVLRSRRG